MADIKYYDVILKPVVREEYGWHGREEIYILSSYRGE